MWEILTVSDARRGTSDGSCAVHGANLETGVVDDRSLVIVGSDLTVFDLRTRRIRHFPPDGERELTDVTVQDGEVRGTMGPALFRRRSSFALSLASDEGGWREGLGAALKAGRAPDEWRRR